ncbi:hypothetical protein [Bacillus sp. Marseille-Q1617]|uniref:hypothetical protein n=1 Tax=Bacillus sp. Marseille-Q1617 TaxID=2736887 RepID=UPI00158C9340|nr:hypothetical protein [Bacillus sp. Marseille-Q1617]
MICSEIIDFTDGPPLFFSFLHFKISDLMRTRHLVDLLSTFKKQNNSLFQLLIGVGDADSCGKSGAGETPQAKPRRLTARPRKAKSPTEIKSGFRTSN